MSKQISSASAVIVTFDNREWLERCIPSLEKQTIPLEIILVDNASLDKASEWAKKRFPQIKIISEKENRGFGAGCNAGARVAKGKYLLFCNEDMVFEKDYVEKLVMVMEKDETIGAGQGTIYEIQTQNSKLKTQNKIQSEGLMFNYTGMLVGRSDGDLDTNKISEIFAATVPVCVRKNTFDNVGGFDEDFFLYFEEVDLCWRIWLNGKQVVLVPRVVCFHRGGVSTAKLPPEEILEYTVRNRLQSYLINLGRSRLVIALIMQLLIGVSAAVVLLLQLKVTLSKVCMRAFFWNLWRLPKILSKRNKVQGIRMMTDRELISRVGGNFPIEKMLFLVGFRKGL